MPVVDRNESYSERRNIQADLWALYMFEFCTREENSAAAAGRGRRSEDRRRKHSTVAQMQKGQLNSVRTRQRGMDPARV